MNVAIKVTEAGTSLGHPMLTLEEICRLNKQGRVFHFLVTDAPDDLPRALVLTQFNKIAPCHEYSKERRAKYNLASQDYMDSPEYLHDQAVYGWNEIAGQPQGAMIF